MLPPFVDLNLQVLLSSPCYDGLDGYDTVLVVCALVQCQHLF